MPTKRDVLTQLTNAELNVQLSHYGLKTGGARNKANLVDVLVQARRVRIDEVLGGFGRERLKQLCRRLRLDDSGKEKAKLVARLAGSTTKKRRRRGSRAAAADGVHWPSVVSIRFQTELANQIARVVADVVSDMDGVGDENGFTSALGHRLKALPPLLIGENSVKFDYRRLNDKTEEPNAGADVGVILSLQSRGRGPFEKFILFQAKKFSDARPISKLKLDTEDAERFRGQLEGMNGAAKGATAGLFYTRRGVYVVDGGRLLEHAGNDVQGIRAPLAPPFRPIHFGVYLGKWVAVCRRGGHDRDVIARIRRPDGFRDIVRGGLGHLLEVASRKEPPSLELETPAATHGDRTTGQPALPAPTPHSLSDDLAAALSRSRSKRGTTAP